MGHYDDYEEQDRNDRLEMDQDYIYYNGFPSNNEPPIIEMCTIDTPFINNDVFNKTLLPTGAEKDLKGKPRFDLIPPEAMKALAEVYSLGAAKYDDRNWEKGIPFSIALGALKRHLNEFELGEKVNIADGNLEHVAHVMWWAVALVTFTRRGREDLNDLPAYKTN